MTTTLKCESKAYFKGLGVRIRQLRQQQGFTQAEVARLLGVSQQTQFAFELGDRRVTLPIAPKLARILGVSVEELMGITKPVRTRAPRRSPKLERHAARLQRLSKTAQRFVVKIIDVLEASQATRR